MRTAAGLARLVAGIVGVVALAGHLIYSLGSGISALPNFFSYFTMQSAIAATILWFIGGAYALRRPVDPHWIVTARLLITTYQIVSGIIYTVIVAESLSRGFSIQVPISSQILHYWLPAFAIIDWVAFPGRPKPPWSAFQFVFEFPLIWAVFTMIRGALVGWYPYFFLDPFQMTGRGEFAAYSVVVLAVIGIVAAILVVLGRMAPRRLTWSRREKRFQTSPGTVDEVLIAEVGHPHGALATHHAHHDR